MASLEETTARKKIEFGAWEEVKIGGTSPCTRYSQAAALLHDTVYLFGGASSKEDSTTTYHDDFFALNLAKSPLLQWEQIQHKGAIPSAREGASFNAVDDKLYLHGGVEKEGDSVCAEGLLVFTPSTATWERLNVTGSPPIAQSSSTVLHEKKLITFGGIIGGKAQNSLHSLNLCTLEWSAINSSGPAPPPRCDHLAAVVGGKMLVTAGSGSDELWFNDIHVLDISCWQWSPVEALGTLTPSPRDYATISTISNTHLLLFGGFSGASGEEECFADLYCADYSSTDFRWQSPTVSGDSQLPARYAHSAVFYKSMLYVFGGQNMEEEFNDAWSIPIKVPLVNFEPIPVPRVRYSTSLPIPAPRKVITPAPPATPKPRDLEEIRTKYVKKINEMFDTLIERFQQLDLATATLESEKAAFENEKKAHNELYEKQQQELDDMLKSHRQQNEEWVSRIREELNGERRALAEEKAAAEEASAELASQQEAFHQKSKKLDAIMRQVQGLKD